MKKIVLVFAGLVIFSPLVLAAAVDEFRDHKAKIFDLRGEVEMQKKGSSQSIPGAAGMVIEQGDRIKTGKASYVEIAYDKFFLNIARIGENTRAEFRGIEPTDVHIENGGVFSNLERLQRGTTYEISTPVAIAGVRGSAFEALYNEVTRNFACEAHRDNVDVFFIDEAGELDPDRHEVVDQGNELSADEGNFDNREEKPLDPQDKQEGSDYRESIEDRFGDEQEKGEEELGDSDAEKGEGEGEGTPAPGADTGAPGQGDEGSFDDKLDFADTTETRATDATVGSSQDETH